MTQAPTTNETDRLITLRAQLHTLAVVLSRVGHQAVEADHGPLAEALQRRAIQSLTTGHYVTVLINRYTPDPLSALLPTHPPLLTEIRGVRQRLHRLLREITQPDRVEFPFTHLVAADRQAILAAWHLVATTLDSWTLAAP